MKIMVLNLGSTSFKFKLFDLNQNEQLMVSGSVDNIGNPDGSYRIVFEYTELKGGCVCTRHSDAFDLCLDIIRSNGILTSLNELDVVGYKAVHGGRISGVQIIDDQLLAVMESFVSYAPAHNPIYIQMMRSLQKQYPSLCQAAYFETSFHTTVPLYRAIYGVPFEWMEQYGIRRYGFHGSSHGYIAQEIGRLEPQTERVISVHLGGSSSLCAIQNGKSVANSMGATPQSGIFHNNRVGDFDVFCLPGLVQKHNGDLSAVMKRLSTESGFLGISGVSNDLREILKVRANGNERADLAVRAFVDGIVGYIGMYTAYLGGLNALVFTGGIGQHSPEIRSMICSGLGFLPLKIDSEKNKTVSNGKISGDQSSVSVWVLETNEELMVARKVNEYLLNAAGES